MDTKSRPEFGKPLMTNDEFEGFVQKHERMVRALARSYCRDFHGAEDIVQEAFLRAFRSLNGVRDLSKLKTWMYTLTRNAALDHLRKKKRQSMEELIVEVPVPEQKTSNDRVDQVMKLVDDMREDYRQIILLRYIDKLSYCDIADALGMTRTAVGEKLHRVRNLVLEKMNP